MLPGPSKRSSVGCNSNCRYSPLVKGAGFRLLSAQAPAVAHSSLRTGLAMRQFELHPFRGLIGFPSKVYFYQPEGARVVLNYTQADIKNYCPAELRPPKPTLGYVLPMIASTSSPNCTTNRAWRCWGDLKIFRPELKPNRITKDEDNNKKPN